jgi:hypothetical protein
MPTPPPIDIAAAHVYFSTRCFNQTWELIEKTPRTPAEDELMRALSHASLWHWMQRPDVTERNLSIGYWQLSRVYALLGRAADAADYGELCLQHSRAEAPFFLGYAHEALARAARVAGDLQRMNQHLSTARQLAEQITDIQDRTQLEQDLTSLR